MLRIPAGAVVATSTVATKKGQAWFAVEANFRLRIYRWWRGAGWRLDGATKLPAGMLGGDATLSHTDVTDGVAPDFTAHAYGADTVWFAIATRRDGRWQFVPFDDQYGRRHRFTFAIGVVGGLVEGMFDSCGCASGPTTYQWYRFSAGVFEATAPPIGSAPCSAQALGAAGHWPPIPYDPLVRHVARPFHVMRFACADGWAVATDGSQISVYEQLGRRFGQISGRRWWRVGVGPPHLVASQIEFALPRSLLQRLGHIIGVKIPAAPLQPTGPSVPPPLTKREAAPITVHLKPGDTYASTLIPYRNPTTLTITIRSQAGATTVTHYRWQNDAWTQTRRRQ